MRIVVIGGAGFLGSNLCDALVARGDTVVCVDNLSTGRLANIEHLIANPQLSFVEHDITEPLDVSGHVDAVANLASPASPPDYHRMPLETLAVGSRGTEHALQLAHHKNARFVLASTSEIYGEPAVHPQVETYWGNVNSIGPRSVYDEAKRYAEAISAAYCRSFDMNVGIVRIFNTYGPRMRAADGRVVSSFISMALNGEPLTIYGDGSQTRSFCFVDDLVTGIIAMLDSSEFGPINLGNPTERTIADIARLIGEITSISVEFDYYPMPVDDPTRRCPDISRARTLLGWEPAITLEEGLRRTVDWFSARPVETRTAAVTLRGPQLSGERSVELSKVS